jgi:ferredoxin
MGARPRAGAPTEALAADYAAGMTLRQLAQKYGITFQAAHERLRHTGVEMRPTSAIKYPPRACAGCGELFKPRNGAERFCSRVCHSQAIKGTHYKTHCKRGHPLTADNLYASGGKTRCKQCMQMHDKASRERKRTSGG